MPTERPKTFRAYISGGIPPEIAEIRLGTAGQIHAMLDGKRGASKPPGARIPINFLAPIEEQTHQRKILRDFVKQRPVPREEGRHHQAPRQLPDLLRGDTMKDEYLGDGVYASSDGYYIHLDLRGQDTTTKIALEPSVFKALVKYEARARKEGQG